MIYRNTVAIFVLNGLLLSGCTKKTDEAQNASQDSALAAQRADSANNARWEAYKAEVDAQIDSNDARIERYRAKADATTQKVVDSLEAKNDRLKQRLAEFKGDSENAWEEFKREFNHDMDQLGTALKDVFKDNTP